MKLLSYEISGKPSFGARIGEGVVEMGARLEGVARSLDHLLSEWSFERILDFVSGLSAEHALSELTLFKPLVAPSKIFCVGVNYVNRNAEYRDASSEPRYPSLFMRTPGSFVASGEALIRPRESVQLDYEGEIAMIIGKAGRRISVSEARSHVFGLTVLNEGTVRDWVRHGKFNVTQGKNFESSGSFGPYLVTLDECPEFNQLQLRTWVNGELRQRGCTDQLLFSFEQLVAYISTFCRLEVGDMISTGTPTGSGARLDPPRFLSPGDQVVVEVEGLGRLENPVKDESV